MQNIEYYRNIKYSIKSSKSFNATKTKFQVDSFIFSDALTAALLLVVSNIANGGSVIFVQIISFQCLFYLSSIS